MKLANDVYNIILQIAGNDHTAPSNLLRPLEALISASIKLKLVRSALSFYVSL